MCLELTLPTPAPPGARAGRADGVLSETLDRCPGGWYRCPRYVQGDPTGPWTCPGGVPVQEEALTVAEAAVRLGVNDKTVRRWVKAGRLSSTLTDGPYGKQYRISADALGAAQQALAVVTVDRGTDPRALALAV